MNAVDENIIWVYYSYLATKIDNNIIDGCIEYDKRYNSCNVDFLFKKLFCCCYYCKEIFKSIETKQLINSKYTITLLWM